MSRCIRCNLPVIPFLKRYRSCFLCRVRYTFAGDVAYGASFGIVIVVMAFILAYFGGHS